MMAAGAVRRGEDKSRSNKGDDDEQGSVVKNANKAEQPQATQSRNPIRRSQSERHLRTTTTTTAVAASTTIEAAQEMCDNGKNIINVSNKSNNGRNNNSNNNNKTNGHHQLTTDHTTNGGDLRFAVGACAGSRLQSKNNNNSNSNNNREEAILSFKDTMALRAKLHRNDSRDLFARPREPPPPPPTSAAATTSNTEANGATAAALGTTLTATNNNNNKNGNNSNAVETMLATKETPAVAAQIAKASSASSITQNSSQAANIQSATQAPMAGNKKQKQQQQQSKDGENVKNARDTKVKGTNGLETRHQQHQEEKEKVEVNMACGSKVDNAKCGMQHQIPNENMRETKATQQEQQKKSSIHDTWETTMRAITTSTPTTRLTTTTNQVHQTTSSGGMSSSNLQVKVNTSPLMPQQQQPQRTIVRVSPFNKIKTTSEVHRLKISHTDVDNHNNAGNVDDVDDFAPTPQHKSPTSASPHISSSGSCFQYNGSTISDATKKTSILINGDDCYSTINLSCDDANTPHYQSSVVVADYSATQKKADDDAQGDETIRSNNNQSSYTDGKKKVYDGLRVTSTTANTVTINVSSPRSAAEELIYHHNKINTMLSQHQAPGNKLSTTKSGRAIIPIKGTTAEVHLQRSASSTSSASSSSMTSISSNGSSSGGSGGLGFPSTAAKRSRTLIKLDYEQEKSTVLATQEEEVSTASTKATADDATDDSNELLAHEEELLKILRNPVEAVKRNLVPHVCGRNVVASEQDAKRDRKMKDVSKKGPPLTKAAKVNKTKTMSECTTTHEPAAATATTRTSFITKLLEDPTLSQVADGLETETVAELIENSLKRLQESRSTVDMSGTKDSDDMNRLIRISLQKIKEERHATGAAIGVNAADNISTTTTTNSSINHLTVPNAAAAAKDEDGLSNRGSISSANSFASANNYELFDFDANESDCYQSCSSEITSPGDDDLSSANTRTKFYQMLVDATLAEIEMSSNMDEDVGSHHYESIRNNGDPIYEEIDDVPPPLPLSAPPPINDADMDKKSARSIFEGASKYDILSYLVDAKERGVVREETFDYPTISNPIIIEEEACDTLSELGKRQTMREMSSRASVLSDSSEDAQSMMSSLSPPTSHFMCSGSSSGNQLSLLQRTKGGSGGGAASDIERNDSGVGSETSKSSRSKYQNPLAPIVASSAQLSKDSPIHLCEDCDGPVETQVTESGIMFAPLVCRKCGKKRVERKEIITEIVETEEKYGRDLQIILEEFCHPMLVAGLLTQEQLSAIFLNTEELLENNQTLAERMRDALDIALEQGDDDLLTVNIGKIFLDFTQMLHAFESYCVRQAGASLLLANLEKEKELLRIFLKVSQMENAVLRRMNLNSFLMVPVQRVTKYPLLLARLYKVTPAHLEGRDQLKQAQEKIELHLNHINQEAKDVPTKLWRRISSSSPNRRASCEIDMINIKLRKMAIDILEWNHDEVRFVMEGKLLYTQPTDSNWKKARTIKLTPVNALLVTNGKPSANYKAEKVMSDKLNFPKHTGIREASLLLVKEKCGRYTLIREPLYLDRCVVCSEADWDDYFEVQEISSKDTFIFKAEDGVRTKQWYTQLQYHAQGMGAWRKRRNALANIMINGMLTRT